MKLATVRINAILVYKILSGLLSNVRPALLDRKKQFRRIRIIFIILGGSNLKFMRMFEIGIFVSLLILMMLLLFFVQSERDHFRITLFK